MVDIETVAAVAHDAGIPLIVDNTMATPYLCKPFEHGADIIVHSTTKFLSGNGSSIGGCVVDSGFFAGRSSASRSRPPVSRSKLRQTFGDLAYTMHSHAVEAFAILAHANRRSTPGLPCLVLKHWRWMSGLRECPQSRDLSRRPSAVDWVSYAGLGSSKYYALRKLHAEAAGVFAFGLKGGYDAGVALVDRCELLSHRQHWRRLAILHPASTTHRQLTEER